MQTVMTEARQRMAEQLYKKGNASVTEIARALGINVATLSYWINRQPWYRKLSRGADRAMPRAARPKQLPAPTLMTAVRPTDQPLSFVIPWTLPGMNEYTAAKNYSRYCGNTFKKDVEDGILACLHAAFPAGTVFNHKVTVEIHFVEKDRRRDYDNIRAGTKFILDALQRRGILRGDGQKYLFPTKDVFSVDKEHPRVEVTLTPNLDCPLRGIVKRKALPMDAGEIRRVYRAAKDRKEIIGVLADLNATTREVIRRIVGEDTQL